MSVAGRAARLSTSGPGCTFTIVHGHPARLPTSMREALEVTTSTHGSCAGAIPLVARVVEALDRAAPFAR